MKAVSDQLNTDTTLVLGVSVSWRSVLQAKNASMRPKKSLFFGIIDPFGLFWFYFEIDAPTID